MKVYEYTFPKNNAFKKSFMYYESTKDANPLAKKMNLKLWTFISHSKLAFYPLRGHQPTIYSNLRGITMVIRKNIGRHGTLYIKIRTLQGEYEQSAFYNKELCQRFFDFFSENMKRLLGKFEDIDTEILFKADTHDTEQEVAFNSSNPFFLLFD